jgi:capsular polysaccharide transport system ATP-binding protein
MIDFLNVSDELTVHGHTSYLFDQLNFHLPPGRYALLSLTPQFRRPVMDVLAGVRPPRRGQVVFAGPISWPVGRNGVASGKASGSDAIRLISTIHDLDRHRAAELVALLVSRPDYLEQPFNTWPQYVKQEFIFALVLLPPFDIYIIDGAIPFHESRFTRMWQSLFEDRLVGKTLILSSPRPKQMLDYCTKGLIYEDLGFSIKDDLETCIEGFPTQPEREELGEMMSAGGSDDSAYSF